MGKDDQERGAIKVGRGHQEWRSRQVEELVAPKKQAGRRRTGTISVSMKLDLRQTLRDLCKRLDVPISEWVVSAIEEKLHRDED